VTTSAQAKLKAKAAILAALHIGPRRTDLGAPEKNGRAKRQY
jgi:hypothetical protein